MQKVRICYRCKNKVYPSKSKEYPYQCFIHDEDLFGIETVQINEDEYISKIAKRFRCSLEEAKEMYQLYDYYVYDCISKDHYPMTMKKFIKSRLNEREERG